MLAVAQTALELRRHLGPNDTIGVTERELGNCSKFVGAVGGKEFKGAGSKQALRIHTNCADDQRANLQAFLHQVQCLHERTFGLLVVHVVAGGQTTDNAQDLLL